MNLEVEDFMGWNNGSEGFQSNPKEPSAETQQTFIKWIIDDVRVQNSCNGPFRIIPSKLFYADVDDGAAHRMYFQQLLEEEVDEEEFDGYDYSAEIHFSLDGNTTYGDYLEISIYGEHPNHLKAEAESIKVRLYNSSDEIRASLQGRTFSVNYENGRLSSFRMPISFINPSLDFGIVAGMPTKYEWQRGFMSLHEFLEEDRVTSIAKSGNHYEVEYVREEEVIKVTRIERGETKDIITIPLTIERESIISDLLPAELKNEPLKENLEVDQIWKNLQLATFGISWERF